MDNAGKSYLNDIRESALRAGLGFLEGKSVLIAGATGLIGSCLADMMLQDSGLDVRVYAMCRSKKRARRLLDRHEGDCRLHVIEHDITLPLESGICFDYIIHAASEASPEAFSKRPVEVMMANMEGTRNLLSYGSSHGMRRMLYVSSAEVYGENCMGRELRENELGSVDILSPRSCYPQAKRAAETLCSSAAAEYGTDVVIARPCHVYGPCFTERDNRAYAQFIGNVLSNEDIVLKSQGSQRRQWCYVVDCAEALLLILRCGEPCQAYNVADRSSVLTIRELAEMIAGLSSRKVVFSMPDEEERRGYNPVQCSLFSTDRLESLGWKPRGTIQEKMEHTVSYARFLHDTYNKQ